MSVLTSSRIASCYGIVGIEDLNLKGLLKNRRLSRSFSDAALGKLLALLTSKIEQRGGQVIKVGRFFPFPTARVAVGNGKIWSCPIASSFAKTPPVRFISLLRIVTTTPLCVCFVKPFA